MKKKIILFFFSVLMCASQAQTVNCDLTLITTIEGFDAYEHNPSGAIIYKAKMAIDADGSPRAYGPNDSGLDWTANAGYPGNWWGVVTDGNGDPVIQGPGDPYPGMYVSTTSLVNSAYGITNPLRYTNSETVPFYVLPTALVSLGGITIGDMGYVYNTVTGQGCYAIYADSGPAGKLGEGSIYLANQIGIDSDPRTGGTSSQIIDYVVFPQSGYGQGTIPTLNQIDSIGTLQINSIGGIGIVGCLDNPINDPANLLATQSVCPVNDVIFTWTYSGSNWHVDVSTSSGFTNFWLKYTNTTSCTGSAGFVDHADGITPLTFQNGITYYWRVTNSNGSINGSPFTYNACDVTAPSTLINIPGNWQTQDFTATFNDMDNVGGSGVNERFYQVLDYNNAEWRGNPLNGFFNDNFSSLSNIYWDVTDSLGAWNASSGNLNQTYTGSNKTRLPAFVSQDSNHVWLYHWQMAFNAGSSRRAGMYIMCSDPTQAYLGDAYMIWFRADDDACQLYTVKGNSISTNLTDDPCTINDGVWYDYKVTYDPSTGTLNAYQNDILISTYTDSAPLKTGSYISLRTGNADVMYDDIKVWKTRNSSAVVSVGNSTTDDIRYQNPDPATSSARIKSLVTDSAGNFSATGTQDVNIDWTDPLCANVYDGTGSDIDTTTSLTNLSANWIVSSDTNSGIAKYWYAIGTSPGATDVVGWTDNALNTSATQNGLSLINGQHYYFSIKTDNAAGLTSICTSDGVMTDFITSLQENSSKLNISVFPNPFSENLNITFNLRNEQNVKILITDMLGKKTEIINEPFDTGTHSIIVPDATLAKGFYLMKFSSGNESQIIKLIKY